MNNRKTSDTPYDYTLGIKAVFPYLVVVTLLVIIIVMAIWGIGSLITASSETVYCYSFPETTEYVGEDSLYYRDGGVLVRAYRFDFSVDCPDSISNP